MNRRDQLTMVYVVRKSKVIVIYRKSHLDSIEPRGMRRQRDVDRFAVINILRILRRLSAEQMIASIAHLCYIAQPQFAGWNNAAGCDSNFLQRQETSVVIEGVHERPVNRGLEPCSLVKGRVVVTDRCVIPAYRGGEVIIAPVLQQQ